MQDCGESSQTGGFNWICDRDSEGARPWSRESSAVTRKNSFLCVSPKRARSVSAVPLTCSADSFASPSVNFALYANPARPPLLPNGRAAAGLVEIEPSPPGVHF